MRCASRNRARTALLVRVVGRVSRLASKGKAPGCSADRYELVLVPLMRELWWVAERPV
jgi:hypothetical protein